MTIEFPKFNCKVEFFVPYNGHQNCLDKSQLNSDKALLFTRNRVFVWTNENFDEFQLP